MDAVVGGANTGEGSGGARIAEMARSVAAKQREALALAEQVPHFLELLRATEVAAGRQYVDHFAVNPQPLAVRQPPHERADDFVKRNRTRRVFAHEFV